MRTNSTNLLLRDSISFCDLVLRKSGTELPDFLNILFGKLGSMPFTIGYAVFIGGVFHIIVLVTKKKVVGTNARGIITFMANEKSLWNRATGKFPRETMGTDAVFPVDSNYSIARFIWLTLPNPTAVSLFNFSPKPYFSWCSIFSLPEASTRIRTISYFPLYPPRLNIKRALAYFADTFNRHEYKYGVIAANGGV